MKKVVIEYWMQNIISKKLTDFIKLCKKNYVMYKCLNKSRKALAVFNINYGLMNTTYIFI